MNNLLELIQRTGLGILLAAELITLPFSGAGAEMAAGKPLEYFIVVTGGELLDGVYPDAHTPFLTRALRPLGCRCAGVMVVDDVRPEILSALAFATNHAPIVLLTGGLGPTPNDITRETLSEFTGIPLKENDAVLAGMERRLGTPRDQLRANLRKQCLVPTRGSYLNNASGTAVGLVFDLPGTTIIALPGPPGELQPMVQQEVVPMLRARHGIRELGAALTLRFVGVGQSQIDQVIKDKVTLPPGVVITSLFEQSRVDFTFNLPGHSEEDQARLQTLKQALLRHLGDACYGEGTTSLEEVVLRLLADQRGHLAVADVGAHGRLSSALMAAPGSQRVMSGAFTAPAADQLGKLLEADLGNQAAGTARAEAMAKAVAKHTGSDWAVSIGGNGATNGTDTLQVALLSPKGCQTTTFHARTATETGRAQLTTQILAWMWRQLRTP